MRNLAFRALVVSVAWMICVIPTRSDGADKTADANKSKPRKVLVELYTSQGCDSCPPASDLLGKLANLGFGPDEVVPLNFHVDYFNTPWVDPYSDASYSQRQQSYNQAKGRSDLYFTPLMMVDGRYPLLGSNRPKAVSSIKQARTEAPGVALDLNLDGKGDRKVVRINVKGLTSEAIGRDVLVGMALTEKRVSTKVPSGENAGKTLVEHQVVRRLDHKFVKLDRDEATTLTFPVELPSGGDASNFGVTVFAQDRANGRVHQADSIPWTGDQPSTKVSARAKPRRKAASWKTSGFPDLDPTLGMVVDPGFASGGDWPSPLSLSIS